MNTKQSNNGKSQATIHRKVYGQREHSTGVCCKVRQAKPGKETPERSEDREEIIMSQQKHIKVFRQHFGVGDQDVVLCEMCSKVAVDIHHIYPRSMGKTFTHNRLPVDINDISNLIALCRGCHEDAHGGRLSKGTLWVAHQHKSNGNN